MPIGFDYIPIDDFFNVNKWSTKVENIIEELNQHVRWEFNKLNSSIAYIDLHNQRIVKSLFVQMSNDPSKSSKLKVCYDYSNDILKLSYTVIYFYHISHALCEEILDRCHIEDRSFFNKLSKDSALRIIDPIYKLPAMLIKSIEKLIPSKMYIAFEILSHYTVRTSYNVFCPSYDYIIFGNNTSYMDIDSYSHNYQIVNEQMFCSPHTKEMLTFLSEKDMLNISKWNEEDMVLLKIHFGGNI